MMLAAMVVALVAGTSDSLIAIAQSDNPLESPSQDPALFVLTHVAPPLLLAAVAAAPLSANVT